jgi:hypothetical protein
MCPSCESTDLEAEYRGKALAVVCPECEIGLVTYNLSPAETKDRTSEEILRSCDRRVHHEYATALRGTCPICGGRTDVEVDTDETLDSTKYYCIAQCQSCYQQVFAPMYVRLLFHPAAVAFYWEYDIDILSVPFWTIHEYIREWEVEVRDEDPFRGVITVRYHDDDGGRARDDEMKLVVDGALDVEPVLSENPKVDG